jgi:PAS domain S-box-containing protein
MQWTIIGALAAGAAAGSGLTMLRALRGERSSGAMAEAEYVIRQRQSELDAIVENLPDIISRFDGQGRYLSVSAKIVELTGKPAAFYFGKTHEEAGEEPVFAMRWRAVLEDVVRNRIAREFDYSYTDPQGRERFYITRALPLLDAAGNVATILTISSDHTERERVARLMQATGEGLRKADLRKNEYLATLAHELRGPLAPIASAAQLIKMSAQRPVREKAREVIERQIGNLSQLVNDLMEVGRISAGKMEIEKRRITIEAILQQAVESTRPLLHAKRQPLALHLPATPLWLDGDLLRLTQVFVNLITNASKYSPVEAPIAIDAHADGGDIVITVRDQGIGLTDEAMLDIFDLFVQVHATGVQAQGGLGIGLSLVRQLVGIHAGTVGVASDGPGQGSCFTVSLPKAEQPAATEAPARAQEAVAASLHVLVVDDNVDGATTLASLLEALGHQAVTAFNGRDAVRLAQEQPVDLAFIDLGLPDISGIQVALTIRGTPQGRKLPLIALTGLGREEDRYMTQAAQFDEHLVKPLQMNDLGRIMASVALKRQPGMAAAQ